MILIVDDEKYIRHSLTGLLKDEGYQADAVASAELAEKIIKEEDVNLIILDIQLPGKDGLTFIEDNKSLIQNIPVIVISGRGSIPTAVSAIKLGAYDYIEKPLNPQRTLLSISQALSYYRSISSERKLVGRILNKYQIIGQSQAIVQLQNFIEKAAASDASVLIMGENGTGKELVAHQIHYRSKRRAEPFVVVNLPAVPETLFESELFGHIRGAFTGALKDRRGRFEQAEKGTLLLDEIGEMPVLMQPKLLRVLETGQFEKLGSDKTLVASCRVVTATNSNLSAMVEKSHFREDLFYRLNVLSVVVPPLRERVGDIPLLLDHFLEDLGVADQFSFSSQAVGLLASYDWPGNVRQLKNFVHQLIIRCDSGKISSKDIEVLSKAAEHTKPIIASDENQLTASVRQFEIGFLSRLYGQHNGNISAMARELNMDRGNLSKKLRQLKIV